MRYTEVLISAFRDPPRDNNKSIFVCAVIQIIDINVKSSKYKIVNINVIDNIILTTLVIIFNWINNIILYIFFLLFCVTSI